MNVKHMLHVHNTNLIKKILQIKIIIEIQSCHGDTRNSGNKSSLIKKNPTSRNGHQLQCHVCCSIAQFARNCPHKPNYHHENPRRPRNESYVATVKLNVIECDISNIKVLHTLILDTGCPQNVAGEVV